MSWTAYVKTAVSTFAIGIAVVAATNAVVDPDGLVGWVDVDGWNAVKSRLRRDTRLFKSRLLAQGDYDGLLLGTSRVKLSMEPRHSAVRRSGAREAFNAGIEGASMLELERVAEYAVRHQDLRVVALGLDFVSFTERRTLPPAFEHSLFSSGRSRWARPSYLFSVRAFLRSLGTVADNRRGVEKKRARSGFVAGGEKREMIDHGAAFDRVLRESYLVQADAFAGFVYGEHQIRAFERTLRLLAERGVRVEVFFTPEHARQMEAIRDLGLLPVWEQWRLDVARAVDAARETWPGRVRLWDFAGYSGVHTEPVPAPGSDRKMRWWYESTHFKLETGDRILERIFGPSAGGGRGFGVLVDSKSLPARHRLLRRARDRWAARFPDDVARVEALVEETALVRAQIPPWEED